MEALQTAAWEFWQLQPGQAGLQGELQYAWRAAQAVLPLEPCACSRLACQPAKKPEHVSVFARRCSSNSLAEIMINGNGRGDFYLFMHLPFVISRVLLLGIDVLLAQCRLHHVLGSSLPALDSSQHQLEQSAQSGDPLRASVSLQA